MNFKYDSIDTFFDADGVACVFVEQVIALFPKIDEFTISYPVGTEFHDRDFNSFGWDIGDKGVMASADLSLFVIQYRLTVERCKNEGITLEDLDLSMICMCGVCDELLFPDDEAYSDHYTGKVLCDTHSVMNDEINGYIEITDETLLDDDNILSDNEDVLRFRKIGKSQVEVYYGTYYLGDVRIWFDADENDRQYLSINHTVCYIDEMHGKFIQD